MNNDDKAYYVALIVKGVLGGLAAIIGAAISDTYVSGMLTMLVIVIGAGMFSVQLTAAIRQYM